MNEVSPAVRVYTRPNLYPTGQLRAASKRRSLYSHFLPGTSRFEYMRLPRARTEGHLNAVMRRHAIGTSQKRLDIYSLEATNRPT